MKSIFQRFKMTPLLFGSILAVTVVATVLVTALLVNIFWRKAEALSPYVRVVEVDEETTDPAKWGMNWPRQYDSYQRTSIRTSTRYGGHGGSETMPEQKSDRNPWIKRMFAGYAFSLDYRDRRGHAYMLEDQEKTDRLTVPQSASCLHCHASIMPLYRRLGDGDALKGLRETYKIPYQEAYQMLSDMGHAQPISCVDCHDPDSMELRVTRPGFIEGIQKLAMSDVDTPHLPSITQWRQTSRNKPYDPNTDAQRSEMRSFVCAQCHVEYYCGMEIPLEFPWSRGLSADNLEQHWNERTFPDGRRFFDYKHAESGAEILKAQHPEFELWSQGIHSRNGVSCADCHMPYMRDGATKVSDHWVRSPLLNITRSCQVCHYVSEKELEDRVYSIQDKNYALLNRSGEALMDLIDAIVLAKNNGADSDDLIEALELQRKAQWRIDFITAENSMGFHAPQEAARLLGEAIDYARKGQVIATKTAR